MSVYLPVVGIDPSLTGTGLATPTSLRTITSHAPEERTIRTRLGRLARVADGIALAVTEAATPRTALVVIEAPSLGSSGRANHQHERSGLWWLLIDRLFDAGHLVAEVTPAARAKYATGRGNASKDEVLAAVVRRYPDQDVRDNNTADALVLRAMGCRHLGQPLEDDLPIAHLTAMDKVVWPDLAGAHA